MPMNLHTFPAGELHLVAQHAEASLALLGRDPTHEQLEDHRTEVLGELLDACDRIETGLGTRLLVAMYPHANRIGDVGARRAA